MPLCRLAIRSLIGSRSSSLSTGRCRHPEWRTAPRTYSTALEEGRRDDAPLPGELDLSKASADSAYLDLILGPSDAALPYTATSRRAQVADNEERARQTTPRTPSKKPRRGRVAEKNAQRSQPQELARLLIRHKPTVQRSKSNDGQLPTQRTQSYLAKKQQRLQSNVSPTRPPYRHRRRRAKENAARTKIRLAREAKITLRLARIRGVRLRTKLVPVRSAGVLSGGFSSKWNQEYANLARYYDKQMESDYLGERIAPKVDPKAKQWAKDALAATEEETTSFLDELAGGVTSAKWHRFWQHIALWLLHHDPDSMIEFLRRTNTSPCPPVTCIDDSLHYLALHFSHKKDATQLQALAELFPMLANRESGGRLFMEGPFFAKVMPYCSHDQINEMYRAIKVHQVKASWNTFLHFATHFANNGHFDQALDAMLAAKSGGAILGSYAFRSNCATLLRNSIRQPAGLRACLRIVDNFVKIGVPLNNQLCNIVMLNAVEAGDLKTAFSIYSSLVQHGLEADSYTYAILLKGCKAAIDDAETLNETIRDAIEKVNVMQNPVIATEILHCLALHHKKHHPQRAFQTLLDAYGQLFDLKPLQMLGLQPWVNTQAHQDRERPQPSRQAIGIMVGMHLEHVWAQTQNTAGAHELYQRFRTLADRRVEPFTSMTETDHISNCFMMTFIKSKKGLIHAAEVIKDMQKPPLTQSTERCRPTQQTWSIFLHGFTRHRQIKLAEQVLNYMRDKGIEPNEVTWNTLVTGYAAVQDFEGTLDVLRRMEVDGATWDTWTYAGLKKLQDQERLEKEWERRHQPPQYDFTSDIKEGLGERLNAFGEAPDGLREKREEVVEGVANSPADLAEADGQHYTPFN